MNDNVQPITPQAAPDLPDLGGESAQTTQGGMSAELPENVKANPMPVWFKAAILAVLIGFGGLAYFGYLVVTKQMSLPGTAQAPALSPIAPPTPTAEQSQVPVESMPPVVINDPSASPYQINITTPRGSETAIPKPQQALAVAPGSTQARLTVDVETRPVIPTIVEEGPIELPPVTKATTAEVLAEHGERLLALENMTAEHAEVLALMKEELKSTRVQVMASNKTIQDAVKKFERVAKQVTTTRTKTTASKTSGSSKAPARSSQSLPFKPLSYRTFGDQVSVRVRAPLQKAKSLRVGQALDGWRLLSADPINRTAVFIHITTFKKEEVML